MASDTSKNEPSVSRSLDWHGNFPWLILFRVFRVAVGLQLLLLATVGAIATTAGWRLAERMFLSDQYDTYGAPTVTERDYLAKWPGQRQVPGMPFAAWSDGPLGRRLAQAPADPIVSLPYRMVTPFWRAIDRRVSWPALCYYLFAGAWTVAVWGFFGGMITRVAVLQLGRDERIDIWQAFEFGRAKWFAHFSGPIMPLVGVALVAAPMAILGLVMRSNLGVVLGGLAWGFVLAGGFLMTLLLASLLFGWPLMWAAISAEGTDGFDAISRTYAYTLQRPLHYFAFALLAGVLGLLGWIVVWAASEAIVGLGYWGTSWGTGVARSDVLAAMLEPATTATIEPGSNLPLDPMLSSGPGLPAGTAPSSVRAGARLIGLWTGLLRSLASGYSYSYFWCATAAIYLLLRRSVDATEMDEVHLVGDGSAMFGLPKLKEGTAAVPELDESGLKPVEPLLGTPPRGGTGSSG